MWKAKDVRFEAVRVVLNKATGTFLTDPTVVADVSFHCIGLTELSVTLVSASAEVWPR